MLWRNTSVYTDNGMGRLPAALPVGVLQTLIMEQQMVVISRSEVERLIRMCARAEGYCSKARPVTWPMTTEDLHSEPTEFYSGASGYAGGTLRDVLQTLESTL